MAPKSILTYVSFTGHDVSFCIAGNELVSNYDRLLYHLTISILDDVYRPLAGALLGFLAPEALESNVVPCKRGLVARCAGSSGGLRDAAFCSSECAGSHATATSEE